MPYHVSIPCPGVKLVLGRLIILIASLLPHKATATTEYYLYFVVCIVLASCIRYACVLLGLSGCAHFYERY